MLRSAASVALVAFLALAAVAPSWWNGFVYDDTAYVTGNPLVNGKADAKAAFVSAYPPGRPDQGLYRPLVVLSYRLDARLWGFAAPGQWNGFHFTNGLLHMACALLVLALARRLGLDPLGAGLGAALFAVHPALGEAFFWVSGRADLLASFFSLAAILAITARSGRWRAPSALLLWLAALLSKENSVALPLLVGALWAFFPSLPRPSRRMGLALAAAALAALAAVGLLRAAALGHLAPTLTAYTGVVGFFPRVFTGFALLWKYARLWVLPFSLSVQHDVRPVLGWAGGLAALASWVAFGWLAWRQRARLPWLGGAAAWFVAGLLPVSSVLVPIGAVFAERFLYLPSALLGPACVAGLFSLARRDGVSRGGSRIAGCVVAVAAAGGLFLDWERAHDWQTDLTLWESAVRVAPESFTVRAGFAEALLREGRFAEAHLHASGALARLEGQPAPYRRLLVPRLMAIDAASQTGVRHVIWQKRFEEANAAARSLQLKEALALYRALAEAWPERAETHEALGDLYIRMENPIAARRSFLEALNLGRQTPTLYAKYGQVLSVLGNKAEAVMAYDTALRANPSDAITHYNRGVALADLGDLGEALAAFREASRHAPKLMAPHLNAAAILLHRNEDAGAREEISRVLEVDPKQEDALRLLQRLEKAAGRPVR